MQILKLTTKRLTKFNQEIEKTLIPILEEQRRTIGSERTDAVPLFVQRKLDGLAVRIAEIFDEDEIAKELDAIGKRASRKGRNELRRVVAISLRDPDIGIGEIVDEFRRANVARIKSLAGQQLVEITEILNDAETPGLRHEVVAKQIRERFDVSKSRAALIARDQVITLNANVAKQRQVNVGIQEYVWTTSGDARVRDEHSARDGQVFRWDTPPSDGHPGEAIQCRCTAFPVIPELDG